MCILFFHFDPTHPRYIFVIASNRDEFFDRPCQSVHQWPDHPDIFASRDTHPERGGGTWIGITKTGRFATLTNYRIDMKDFKMDAQGRGFLVTDYLKGAMTPSQYCADIHQKCEQYNGFNLLTGTLWGSAEQRAMHYVANAESKPCQPVEHGVHGLANRLLDSPWGKLTQGKSLFSENIKSALSSSEDFSEEEMIQDLLQMLLTNDQHYPDPNVQETGHSEEIMKKWSSICVRLPLHGHDYGTRTRTVILVRADGSVSYVESTLDGNTSQWDTKRINFSMS